MLKTLKNFSISYLLPVLSLFSFLFYVFWTYPVQILSQELSIGSYYIFNNPFLLFSLVFCGIIFIIIYITNKYSSTLYYLILTAILFGLLLTFFYKYIFSFQFGSFIDNMTLTSENSLIDFNNFHYVLDIIFVIISVFLSFIIVYKKLFIKIFFFFLLFYSIENTLTLTNLKITPVTYTESNTITLSRNQPNLLFFMYDSVSLPIMLRVLELWSPQKKAWTKDFTFYDNVTGLSVGGTLPSLPSMLGGYQFSKQKQLADIIQNNITIDSLKNPVYYPIPSYVHTDKALQSVAQKLNQNITIHTLDFTDSIINTNLDIAPLYEDILNYKTPPIISVSLYQFIPYILRKYLTATPVTWRGRFNTRWLPYINNLSLTTQNTEKPVFYFLENIGGHSPFLSPTSPITVSYVRSMQDLETVLFHQLDYNMLNMNTFINYLKDNQIYDSTRIVVTSDHGINAYTSEPLIAPYLKSLSTSNLSNFYKEPHDDLKVSQLPVFIMDKNFNTVQKSMKKDSRFLSLGDLHTTILNTFTNNSKTPDYLQINPPKRQFNIPLVSYQVLEYLMDNKNPSTTQKYQEFTTQHIKNNGLSYYQVNSVKEGLFEMKYFDYDKIGELSAVEILE